MANRARTAVQKPLAQPVEAASFSPGPWRVRMSLVASTYTHICSDTDNAIACTKSEANALLVAAAPDLLAALIEAESIVKSAASKEITNDSLDTTARHAHAAIVAALKKARG